MAVVPQSYFKKKSNHNHQKIQFEDIFTKLCDTKLLQPEEQILTLDEGELEA